MHGHTADVQYLTSLLYHNMGRAEDRDQTVERWKATEEWRITMEEKATDEEGLKVMDVVYRVGAALTAR